MFNKRNTALVGTLAAVMVVVALAQPASADRGRKRRHWRGDDEVVYVVSPRTWVGGSYLAPRRYYRPSAVTRHHYAPSYRVYRSDCRVSSRRDRHYDRGGLFFGLGSLRIMIR